MKISYEELLKLKNNENKTVVFVISMENKDDFNNAYNIIYGAKSYFLITPLLKIDYKKENIHIINSYYNKIPNAEYVIDLNQK